MRDKLCALLGIKSGEESKVSMLLTQSVFLGIFFGAFDITAHSLFLSTFDEKMLARGYAVSGIAGIILTSLYSRLQTKIQFRYLAAINLIIVTVITLLLWLALILSPAKPIIFIVFIMLGPLNVVALLGFWGTADRLFSRKEGAKLFRLADAGLILGIIIISYAIPILLYYKLQTHSILLLSASSVFVVTIIQIVMGTEFFIVPADAVHNQGKTETGKSLFISFREDQYLRTIAIFAVLSVLASFFIQYSFMAVTREQFPVAADMAKFFGLFTGSMMIFILFFKQFVFKYVLDNYGLRACLIISSVFIGLFTAIATAFGLLMGYTPEKTTAFLIFFILLGISRIISKSLKDSIEYPSFKVIWKSVEQKFKSDVRSGMFGTINEIMVLFSGLILTGIGIISFIRLIHFPLLLVIISLIWLFVSFRLYKEYRKSLIKAIENEVPEGSESDIQDSQYSFKKRFYANINFRKDYFSFISGDYSVLNRISNKWYFEKIIDYAYSKNDINLLPVLRKTSGNANLEEGIRKHAADVAEFLQKSATSLNTGDIKFDEALKILSGTRKPQTTEILRLLRENSVESKRLALYMIGKFKISDLLSEVCECLIVPGLTVDASEVLKTFGSGAEDELIRFYLVTSGNIKLSKVILQILGIACSKETKGFLFSRLWSNSRQLKEIVIKSLINCKFKPTEEEKRRLDQLSSDQIGLITWNLTAKTSLERNNDKFLLEKIDKEIDRSSRFLFNILSVTYNSASIARIRQNLESEAVENVSFALGMTDVLVSESLKRKLITLLDVVPQEDKLQNLFEFFPGEIPPRKKLLEDIINRDYNLISLWTKACALRSITRIEDKDMAESVTALLFSPEELIQEESANLISRSTPALYRSASERITETIKKRLDKIILGESDMKELLFEKVQFLSKIFSEIPVEELLMLASEIKHLRSFETVKIGFSEGCIIWPLDGDNEGKEVYVLYNGDTENLIRKYKDGQNHSFYYLTLKAVEEFHFQFPDKSFEILKYIDDNEE